MALVNHEKKEINAKIVFYGPGSGGKTTNVKFLYEKMKPEFRGTLKFLNTRSGKMLFFDFMRPEQIGIQDYDVRFHVYTVQGDVSDYAVWKTVLKGMDGLVFVADSEPYRMPDNLQCFEKLSEYLKTLGKEIKDLPCLLQCNKQDIPGATTIEDMKDLLHSIDCPIIPASAKKGEGVLGTLSNIVRMVLQKLRETPLDADREEKQISADETPAPPISEERQDTDTEGIAPATADILSEPLTDTAPNQEFVSALASYRFGNSEPEPSLETLESGISAGDVAELDEEMDEELDETPLEAISTPEEETDVCEQAPDFISFGGFTSEATRHFAPSEEIKPLSETSGQDTITASIDFDGEMEQVSPGELRLPVTIRYGQETKKIAINLKLSIEALVN